MFSYSKCLVVVSAIIAIAFSPETPAAQSSINHFFGEYRGVSVEDPSQIWLPADLDVSIRSHDKGGFVLEWATVTKADSGQIERQNGAANFHPTKRPNVYASAMRPDLFGGRIPLDPFKGDPFIWARILNSTLTVYTMIITETGAHDMQIYDRTLIPDGFSIKFKRLRNENPLQTVTGKLKRVK